MKKLVPILVFLFTSNSFLFSQEENKGTDFHTTLKIQTGKILIRGESNINKWQSNVEAINAKFTVNSLQKPSNFQILQENSTFIETLIIKIKVTDIKSGKKLMDKKTYKALKSIECPYIIFTYAPNSKIHLSSQIISGNLTVAGVTKKITTQITFNKERSTLTLKGIHSIDMTEFGVKPPQFLMGMLKTKKKIDIDFTLAFKPNL
uniref:YceI family protein n=1 Tax=Polaribacter sp. TaxID=1920175 RepID=UPI0040476015